jgi:hypothetical protein
MFCTYSKNWYIQLLPALTSLNKQFTELFYGMKLTSIYDPEVMQHTDTSVSHFYRIKKNQFTIQQSKKSVSTANLYSEAPCVMVSLAAPVVRIIYGIH